MRLVETPLNASKKLRDRVQQAIDLSGILALPAPFSLNDFHHVHGTRS